MQPPRFLSSRPAASSSRRRLALAALAAGTLAAAVAPHARAALAVTDQSNTVSNGSLGVASSSSVQSNAAGQSFTPTLAAMNAATFPLDTNGGTTSTVTLNVYAGAGFGGTLLGTSAPVTFTNSAPATVEFDLSGKVTLTPGSVYTLGLTDAAGSNFAVAINSTNPYAGGTLYYGSTSYGAYDAVFAEGTAGAGGVPEPSTWAALALGGAGLAGVTLRRRASAAGRA